MYGITVILDLHGVSINMEVPTLGQTNGKSWSHTRTPYGGYGTDSSGRSFSYYD